MLVYEVLIWWILNEISGKWKNEFRKIVEKSTEILNWTLNIEKNEIFGKSRRYNRTVP